MYLDKYTNPNGNLVTAARWCQKICTNFCTKVS